MGTARYRTVEVDGRKTAETLDKLHRICLPGDEREPTTRGWWWITTCKGEPVAFAGLRDLRGDFSYAYLNRAGVVPAHRGSGLHHRLIRTRIRKARDLGFTYVVTATLFNNRSANNLIEHGFRLYNPVNPWLAKGALYWIRKTS